MMKDILEAEILPKSFADHSPLLIKIHKRAKRNVWRMNTLDLDREDFIMKLKKENKEFFRINNTESMEKRTIWNAGKAFARGLAIQYRIRKIK